MKNLKTIFYLTCFFLLTFFSTAVFAEDTISYSAHIENIGWMNPVTSGQTAGTTGKALQMEAIRIQANNGQDNIEYSTHVENIGWMDPVKNNEISGTTGRCLQIEAIKISITGALAERNDIYYRTHVSDLGWMGWTKNGASAGTTGGCKQVEAIEIKLVPKGSPAPGSTTDGFYDFKNQNIGPSTAGALKVSGNQLTSQSGAPIQLRGVSTHGLSWFPDYVNLPLFNELHNQWKANVVRLAMYTAEYNGYCTGGDQTQLKNLVKTGINCATAADMYVIVDWHVLNDQDPNLYKELAKEFFNDISSQYGIHNNIIYEICNEPNGGVDWNSIKKYALEVIPVIRANDPDAIIIVGTPTWSQDVDQAAQNPISEYNNIMYACHFYAGTHKADLRNKMINAYNTGLPIFVSEFGICDASGNGGIDINSANEWISTLNNNKMSYVAWSLCNKNESASLIRSDCSKLSGFTNTDLSTAGNWLLGILSSPGLSGSENTEPQTPTTPDKPNTPDTPVTPTGNVDYSLTASNTWVSGDSTFTQYTLIVTNNSNNTINSWNKNFEFNQDIEVENSWNCNISVTNNVLSLSNVDYNGTLNPGQTAEAGLIIKSKSSPNFK